MYYVRTADKYGAQKTEFNGRVYDSKGQAGLAQELLLLQKAGEVIKIKPQKTFNLYGRKGGCTHRVDFFLTFKRRGCWFSVNWRAGGSPYQVSRHFRRASVGRQPVRLLPLRRRPQAGSRSGYGY